MPFLMGFIAALALLLIGGIITVWTGAYNFAASEAHAGSVRSIIDTALRKSVASRADDLQAPASFTSEQLRQGAAEFGEYCVHCHGAPGVEPHEWASGMRPDPPALSRAAAKWSTEEIFWIVKHGVKMTGMPSFGDTESDETIWQIAAFVKQLPETNADEYRRLQPSGASGHEHGAGH